MSPKRPRKKITEVQALVLESLKDGSPHIRPRSSLDRLQKKGLVVGNRRTGWVITPAGLRALGDTR